MFMPNNPTKKWCSNLAILSIAVSKIEIKAFDNYARNISQIKVKLNIRKCFTLHQYAGTSIFDDSAIRKGYGMQFTSDFYLQYEHYSGGVFFPFVVMLSFHDDIDLIRHTDVYYTEQYI